MNVELANSTTELVIGQAIFYYVKNNLVAHGGWEVIGSSNGTGTWEYEGVTGGGSYGGGSTGPYDVWTTTTDIRLAQDGSSPGWAVLKGPTWEGSTPYLILSYEGTNDTQMFMAGCGEKPELVGGAAAYIPVAPAGIVEYVEFRRTRWFYSDNQQRGQLSICTDNGSFILVTDRIGSAGFNGIMAFVRLDPRREAPTFALASGNDGSDISRADPFTQYWKCWAPVPQAWGEDVTPLIADTSSVQWAEPMRSGSTQVMLTDLGTVNGNGSVDPFPFYLAVYQEVSNLEYKGTIFGRVPDVWIAPYNLTTGDTAGEGGSVEYYVCGYWMFPGDTAPVVG